MLVQAGKDAAQLFALFIARGFVDERSPQGRAGRRTAVSMAASDTESGANGKQAEPRHPLRRTDPSRATGGKKGAKPRFTAPAYWKFESTSLQRRVGRTFGS